MWHHWHVMRTVHKTFDEKFSESFDESLSENSYSSLDFQFSETSYDK